MKIAVFLTVLVVLAACSKKEPPKAAEAPKPAPAADNAAVNYAENLKKDAEAAQAVKDKANAALSSQDQALKEADGR